MAALRQYLISGISPTNVALDVRGVRGVVDSSRSSFEGKNSQCAYTGQALTGNSGTRRPEIRPHLLRNGWVGGRDTTDPPHPQVFQELRPFMMPL